MFKTKLVIKNKHDPIRKLIKISNEKIRSTYKNIKSNYYNRGYKWEI